MVTTTASQKGLTHPPHLPAPTSSAPSVQVPSALVAPTDGPAEARAQAPKSPPHKADSGLQTPTAGESRKAQGARTHETPAVPSDAELTFEEVRGGGGDQRVQQSLGKLFDRVGLSTDPDATHAHIEIFTAYHEERRTNEEEKAICQAAARTLSFEPDPIVFGESMTRGIGESHNTYALTIHGETRELTAKQICASLWEALETLPAQEKEDAKVVFVGALGECQSNGRHLPTARQMQRLAAYMKEFFPELEAVVMPPINPGVYAKAIDNLVRGHLPEGGVKEVSHETRAKLHDEATVVWAHAIGYDTVCYDEGYLSFDEAHSRAVELQKGLSTVMNATHKLGWAVPELPNEALRLSNEALFDEAQAQHKELITNPGDLNPARWQYSRDVAKIKREFREIWVRVGGMIAGGAFGPVAMLMSGQAAVQLDRAVADHPQNFRSSLFRAGGMMAGTLAGGGLYTAMIGGNVAVEFDNNLVSHPENRQAVVNRLFGVLRGVRVKATELARWVRPEEEIAPLFVREEGDEDAEALDDDFDRWLVVSRD